MGERHADSRILIIDDQLANTQLLEGLLKINNFTNYKSVNDSRQALTEIKNCRPDLLLLDVMMPHVNGIEILEHLLIDGTLDSPMRVMVLTADVSKETLKLVLKSGAHDMLRKPFDLVELELRIRNLLHTNFIMKQLNDQSLHLASLVEQRTEELISKNEELEQFIHVASHDTQEPLRMITGFMQLLEKKYGDQLDDKGKQYIQYAIEGALRMKTLIKDILEFSKAGKIQNEDLEKVDLNELLNDALLGLQRFIENTNAKISFNDLPQTMALEAPLRQVFQNLLINAMTYQPEGQSPEIEITSAEKDGSLLVFVKDNGIGIAPENQKKIFDIFTRLHNKEKYPGSGIGLSISKKLMERIGGTITVESSPEKGSVFCIHFPS